MGSVPASVEIDRSPAEVFGCAVDPANLAQWQEKRDLRIRWQPARRRLPGRLRPPAGKARAAHDHGGDAYDAPRGWSMKGIDGPVRPLVDTLIEPIADGSRSRVTIELDFRGHGIGKVLIPLLVRPETRKGLPRNLELLKEKLERR